MPRTLGYTRPCYTRLRHTTLHYTVLLPFTTLHYRTLQILDYSRLCYTAEQDMYPDWLSWYWLPWDSALAPPGTTWHLLNTLRLKDVQIGNFHMLPPTTCHHCWCWLVINATPNKLIPSLFMLSLPSQALWRLKTGIHMGRASLHKLNQPRINF